MNERPLFHKYRLSGALEAQREKLDDHLQNIDSNELRTADLDHLAATLYEEFKANPVVIDESEIEAQQTDAKIDVRYDRNRDIWDRSKPFYVDGIRVRFYVPFTGDVALLDCQPSSFTTVWPRVADIKDNELIFEYDRPDRSVDGAKAEFDQELRLFKQWLGWSVGDVRTFNDSLPPRIKSMLAARRDRLGVGQGDVAKLGLRLRAAESLPQAPTYHPPAPSPRPKQRRAPASPAKAESEYDVALSFAGEDRDYVARVAAALQAAGIRVFYDKFEEVKLWGRDLAEHFSHVYGKASRFIVLFGSAHYAAKAWPTFERRQALGKSIREFGNVVILPVRFDDTEVPGLTDTRAYMDARKYSPEELANMIIEKIRSES